MALRIAYVCHYFVPEPAAPAARVHEFARAWVHAGHEVTVITTFPNHPLGRIPPAYRGRSSVSMESFPSWSLAAASQV